MANFARFTWAAQRDTPTAQQIRLQCGCRWVAEGPAGATMSFSWITSGGNSRGCSITCTNPQAESGRTCPPLAPPLQRCLLMLTDFPIPRCIFPVLCLHTVQWFSGGQRRSYAGSKSLEPNLVDLLFLCNNMPRMASCYQLMSPPFLPPGLLCPPSQTPTLIRLSCLGPPSVVDIHSFRFKLQKIQQEVCIKLWLWRDSGTGTLGMLSATPLLPPRDTKRASLGSPTLTLLCTRRIPFKANRLTCKRLRYPSQPASMVIHCMGGKCFHKTKSL